MTGTKFASTVIAGQATTHTVTARAKPMPQRRGPITTQEERDREVRLRAATLALAKVMKW